MLQANYQKVGRQFDHAQGGISNEDRFALKEAKRTKKRLTVASLNGKQQLVFEQNWNPISSEKDVVRITLKGQKPMVFYRIDLEQAVLAMAQADETLKYFKAEARSQRKHSEPGKKDHLYAN